MRDPQVLRLITEDIAKDAPIKQRQPLPFLPTVEGEIAAPKEGLWTDAQNKPVFYLGMVHLQVLRIDEAWALCSKCFGQFERGPGKQFEEVIRMAKSSFSPTKNPNPALQRLILQQVEKRIKEQNLVKLDDEFFAEARECILPFTDKYCCRSEAMVNYLRFKWAHDILWSEVSENRPHQGFRMTRRGNQRANVIKDSSGRLKKSYLSFLAQIIGGDFLKHTTLLLSPEQKRIEEADRESDRQALNQANYHLKEIRPLIEGAWLFVELEIRHRTVDELTILAANQGVELPHMLYKEPREISKYLKPYYDALGLERSSGRPPKSKSKNLYLMPTTEKITKTF